VVYGGTYYYYEDEWYREVIYEGETGGVQTTPPVGHETDELPQGAQSLPYGGDVYSYANGAFYKPKPDGGWIVVEPLVGAEVSSIPAGAVKYDDEGSLEIYQFDGTYWSKFTNFSSQTAYRVEPPPPAEEIDEIPTGSPSFVADGERYFYVNYSWYVAYEVNGKQGYTNGEPGIDAQVEKLPSGSTQLKIDGVTYQQFDTLYFEQVEDANGSTFYQIVDLDEDGVVEVGGN